MLLIFCSITFSRALCFSPEVPVPVLSPQVPGPNVVPAGLPGMLVPAVSFHVFASPYRRKCR